MRHSQMEAFGASGVIHSKENWLFKKKHIPLPIKKPNQERVLSKFILALSLLLKCSFYLNNRRKLRIRETWPSIQNRLTPLTHFPALRLQPPSGALANHRT